MKAEICKAFCDSVSVRSVPAGVAISTDIASINGDPIGFYAVGPLADGRYRLEDSGLIIPYLYSVGADLENATRRTTFEEILRSESASWNEDSLEIISEPMQKAAVPAAALRFVSLLLRINDMAFMAQERAASTFKDDAISMIRESLGDKAQLREGEPISNLLSDWEPDLVIDSDECGSMGVFLVQTDSRILEAIILHSEAVRSGSSAKIVALLERETSISQKTRVRALNRLDATMVFDGDEQGAIGRVATLALGRKHLEVVH